MREDPDKPGLRKGQLQSEARNFDRGVSDNF